MKQPAFEVATITLHEHKAFALTESQRAIAEGTLARYFGIVKYVTERQAEAHNRWCERTLGGPREYLPIYAGWFTFNINAQGKYINGCGEYASRDEALWQFHLHHRDDTPEDEEAHRRALGFPPSKAAA